MQIIKSDADRRSRKRISARLPVKVRTSSAQSELNAETRDLSTNGVFLYTQSRLEIGSSVELVLILPPELNPGAKAWVCCHARVVRVEQGADNRFGVAAEIERMDVLPEITA
jgi:c-di-GMP-binding flagellar brake protein YcgR